MPGEIDLTKLTVAKAEPPTRYGRNAGASNPLLDLVKDAAIDGEWREIKGLSEAKTIATIHPKTKAEHKVSELDQVKRLLRRGAAHIRKGMDTTMHPADKGKGVNLYFRVRDRRPKATKEEAST